VGRITETHEADVTVTLVTLYVAEQKCILMDIGKRR